MLRQAPRILLMLLIGLHLRADDQVPADINSFMGRFTVQEPCTFPNLASLAPGEILVARPNPKDPLLSVEIQVESKNTAPILEFYHVNQKAQFTDKKQSSKLTSDALIGSSARSNFSLSFDSSNDDGLSFILQIDDVKCPLREIVQQD